MVAHSSKPAAKRGRRSSLDHESKAITWSATNLGGVDLELEIGKKSSVHQLPSLTRQAGYIEPSRRGFGMGCSDTRVSIGETEYFRRMERCDMCAAVHLQVAGTRREIRKELNLLGRGRCHPRQGERTCQNRFRDRTNSHKIFLRRLASPAVCRHSAACFAGFVLREESQHRSGDCPMGPGSRILLAL